jgi:hypothetical protein
MPSYRWFYDEGGYPNKKGMAIITYVQWLGSWLSEYPYWRNEGPVELEAGEPPEAGGRASTRVTGDSSAKGPSTEHRPGSTKVIVARPSEGES